MNWKATALIFAAAAAQAAPPRIGVALYNFAGLDERELTVAKAEAGRILEYAGVHVIWAGVEPVERADYPLIRVRLRATSASVTGKRLDWSDLMGRAYRDTLTSDIDGSFIDAYREDIEKFAASFGARAGAVLGCVLVHELGHLLLGSAHTSAGLMSGRWGSATIDELQKRRLRFDRKQRNLIVLRLREAV
jgi:hypothetical protein